MKKKFRNIFSVFLSILMFLSVFFDAFGNMEKTFANSDIITDIQLDKTEFNHAQSFKVMVKFGGKGTKVKEGQQEEIKFLSDKVNIILPSSKITLENSQGINLGTISFQNKKATITFNETAASLEDIEGEFSFSVFGYYDGDKAKDGEGSVELTNHRIHKKIKLIYKKGWTVTNEVYSKKGVWSTHHQEGNRLEWVFRFNAAKKEAKSTGGGYYTFKVTDDLPSTMVWDVESINKNPYILELNGERWISIVEAQNMGFKINFDRQNLVIEIPNWVHQNSMYLNPLDKRELTIRLMAKVKDEVMKNKSITHVHNSSNPELQNLDWQIDPSTISDSVEIIRKGGWATGTNPGELKIKKVIKGTQTPIEGVKFKLSRIDGRDVRVKEGAGYVYKSSVILTTNHEGIASVKGLEYTTYVLEEIETPEWIKYDVNKHFRETFVISDRDSEGKKYTIENEKKDEPILKKGKFIIHKKSNNGSFLDNAKFKLTGVGTSYNEEKISSNGGKVLFENLSPGNYTLEEIESPEGYTKSENTWNIEVEQNGKTIIKDNSSGKIIKSSENSGKNYVNNNINTYRNSSSDTNDIFESNGGSYTLGYILKNYNIFVSEDYAGTHVVGPVIVGGKFKNYQNQYSCSFGGLTAPSKLDGFPHKVPSYFGGEAEITGNTLNVFSDVGSYFGTINKRKTFYYMKALNQIDYSKIKYTDKYIDIKKWNELRNEAFTLNESGNVKVTKNGDNAISSDNGKCKIDNISEYSFKYKLNIKAGTSVTIDVDILKESKVNIIGNTVNNDTIIYSDGENIKFPPVLINNENPKSIETEPNGVALVFAFPNADIIEASKETTGHIIAPNAEVVLNGGNFNGCIIAKKVYSRAEGHMWPYNGKKIDTPILEIINNKKSSIPKKGKIIIEKINEHDRPLDGAIFELTGNSKKITQTSVNGKVVYDNLDPGTYKLKEKNPPAGYEKTNDEWTVTVDKDGFTRVEKSTKSSKFYSLDSSEESGKRQFRSASPSSYNIPRSLKSLYRGNIIPVSRSGNSMDGLYNKNAQPNPSFTYQDSSSGRTGEKYKNPKITDGFYNYKGNFKGKSVDVAGVNKYLEPTKKPGEYIVHLKVKGNTIKEENKIGVVVVYDNSGSMYTNDRYSKAHTATSKFIRTLLSNENVEAALVTYSNHVLDGEEHYNHKDRDYETVPNACTDGFTSSADTFIKALPKSKNIKAAHGTNTAAALVRARKLLDESGNKYDRKFVIVVTDGAPTYSPMIIDAYDDVSFRPNVEFSSDEKKTKGNGEEYSLKRKSKKEYEKEYKVRHYTINNHGTTCEYACNNLKEKGVEIHTVGIEIDGKKEGIDKKTATDSMKKMSSRDDYYYDTTNVDLLSDNLTKILEKIDMDTIEYGSIEDKIGEKVIFEENSYDIKGFKDGVLDDDITQYVYKNYDKNEKKLTISNLYIGENEHCEITYKVHLDIENGNIKSGEFYKTNESATLTPHWQHNNIKWKFPEPAISATLKNVKLKKRWQNQSEKTSNDEITFQLQRKIKGQGDEEYKDIADKYIRKKIKDISNTEFTHTFNDLIPFNNNGEIYEYRVIEKGVPNGYDPIIDTDGEGNTDIINREIPVVKVKNKPNNVEFTKVSSIGQPLGGAIFKLQKEELTNTWKDVDRYKNITSNNLEAKIQMEKLAPGKYRLIETKAPEGFITPNNNQPVATFTVNKDGNIIDKKTNNDKNTIIINHPQAVDLTLFKYEGNESAQKPLRGATFKIYKNDSRPDKNNPTEEVIIKGVSEWMTNGDGEVTINGLTNGTYWLRETKPPEGYERIEGFIGKIIVKDGKLLYNKQPLYNDKGKSTQDNKIELKQNTLEIQNKKNYIELEKCYKDISGTEQPLNGAKFGLYKEVNNSYVQYLRENEHYIVSSGHTGEAGKFRFEKLEPGKYAVREEEAPLGFEKIDGNIITFTVKENGDYVDIENIQYNKISNNVCKIINKRKPMKFYIIKTDSNGLKLSDGILGVKIKDLKFNNGKDEKEFNLASDYEKYDSSRVQKEGLKIEVPVNTKSGTYTLKEIRAPQGFQLSNKEYKIRIDSENRRIELLGDKNSVKQVLYEENSNNSTIELGSPIEIKNKRVEYPNTGGIGTLLFTVIGGGLMVISSIFIMRKKRRI